jgi:hypothetical protein
LDIFARKLRDNLFMKNFGLACWSFLCVVVIMAQTITSNGFAYWDTILFSSLCLFIGIVAFVISYNEAQESQKKSARRPNSEVRRLNME